MPAQAWLAARHGRPLRHLLALRAACARLARLRRLACALSALAALTCAASQVRAQQAESPEYRRTIDDAVTEFRSGHWEEARALFARAHELEPSARTLRGLGMTAFELRMYVQSMRELDGALRETRKPLDAGMRAAAEALIAKARGFVARVEIAPSPKDAALIIDGRHAQLEPDGRIALDAGLHVVSASADGYKPASLRFAVEGGRDQVLQLPLEPLLPIANQIPAIDPNHPVPAKPAGPEVQAQPVTPPPAQPAPPPKRSPLVGTLAWVTLGGAVVFGGAATATWLIGDGKYGDLEDECMTMCEDKEIDDAGIGTTDALTSVFLGVAIASGVASGVLFAIALSDSDEQAPSTAALSVGVAPNGLRLQGAF
jgi:hypothetical protein